MNVQAKSQSKQIEIIDLTSDSEETESNVPEIIVID